MKLFQQNHSNRVKLYNLCGEPDLRSTVNYRRSFRGVKKESLPCTVNEPISLSDMLKFSLDAIMYLSKHRKNTIAVHCDDGRHRSGAAICAFLILYGPDFIVNQDTLQGKFVFSSKDCQDHDQLSIGKPILDCKKLYEKNVHILNSY